MEITVGLFLLLIVLTFFCEYIDATFGMGYGTILAPILLIIGFDPITCIPALLLSQAVGGMAASVFHHQFENVSFSRDSDDLKAALLISSFGIVATIVAAFVAVHISTIVLKTYIGILVFVMGVIVLMNRKFKFSWKKMVVVGALSAFNKGLSGGGFGPVVTAGQIMSGQKHKAAIGVTTLAEVPICATAFFAYLIARTIAEVNPPILGLSVGSFMKTMFSPAMFNWELMLALLIGVVLVAPFGAFTTKKLSDKYMHLILGSLIAILGLWELLDTYLK